MSKTQRILALNDETQIARVLLGAIWGGDYAEQNDYLRVFVGQLRKQIEADLSKPRYILTEPWIGHRFNPGS